MVKKTVFNDQTFVQRNSGLFVPHKGQIIASTPAVGKTFVGNNYEGVLDLSARKFFEAEYQEGQKRSVYEKSKVIDYYTNQDYPHNYIDAIVENQSSYELVLTAFLADMVLRPDFTKEYNDRLDYLIALPKLSSLERIFERMVKRGNNREFINLFKYLYPIILEKFGHQSNCITIEDGEFLEDTLIRHKLIAQDVSQAH